MDSSHAPRCSIGSLVMQPVAPLAGSKACSVLPQQLARTTRNLASALERDSSSRHGTGVSAGCWQCRVFEPRSRTPRFGSATRLPWCVSVRVGEIAFKGLELALLPVAQRDRVPLQIESNWYVP